MDPLLFVPIESARSLFVHEAFVLVRLVCLEQPFAEKERENGSKLSVIGVSRFDGYLHETRCAKELESTLLLRKNIFQVVVRVSEKQNKIAEATLRERF